MPVHEERRRVAHAPDDVFTLVADVRDYPNFIDWVRAMRVLKDETQDGVGALTAEAIVGYKLIRERFTTNVSLDKPNLAVDVSFVSGPFKALENRWRFHPRADGTTDVEFHIRYEFSNPILSAILSANFDRAAEKIMTAFEERARERFALIPTASS